MRVFISAGEPSGDIHGASLIHAARQAARHRVRRLRRRSDTRPEGRRSSFRSSIAVMCACASSPTSTTFLGVVSQTDRYFRHHRPDAEVILIDYPGLHWWIARRAKMHGIPVYYFVPPQLWAWAGWRVKKMKRFVDHVLCTLPFERTWYAERGLDATYVGHPFFDELPGGSSTPAPSPPPSEAGRARSWQRPARLADAGGEEQRRRRLRSAPRKMLLRDRPAARFLVASFKASQQAAGRRASREESRATDRDAFGPNAGDPGGGEGVRRGVRGRSRWNFCYRQVPSVILYRMKRSPSLKLSQVLLHQGEVDVSRQPARSGQGALPGVPDRPLRGGADRGPPAPLAQRPDRRWPSC